jgi:CHRD domain
MRTFLMTAIAGTALAVALALGAPANAAAISFKADLTGAQETPPTDSKGKGAADVAYDAATKTLTWTVTYSGLTGPATAAHFHGPAKVGSKASPVVPITGDLKSPIKGKATLTDQQAKDLQAGLWYLNIHTAKFPDGEIRGQLTKK